MPQKCDKVGVFSKVDKSQLFLPYDYSGLFRLFRIT